MLHCDKFILADNVQYTTQSYINRVQIKTASGKLWLTVPVLTTGKRFQKIKDIRIIESQHWQNKHWKTINLNYRSAPFFDDYAGYLEKIYQKKWRFLVDLNIELINFSRKALHIPGPLIRGSDFPTPESPTVRIVEMIKKCQGTEYISGKSGKKYLEESLFIREGINLKYIDFKAIPYHQQFSNFIPNLSIIDLLFNEGDSSVSYLKNSGKIIEAE
jgi:hypothetical protein